jgi:hypothetical protein
MYEFFVNLNWQIIVSIIAVNWYFTRDLREKIEKLEDRMFLLSTGKSIADAIKEERIKKES